MPESSAGIVPVSLLLKRERPASFVNSLIVVGIVDDSSFDPRSRTVRFFNRPISVGIDEEILFSNNDNLVKFVALNNSWTRTPENLFDERSSTCRPFRSERIEDGISPESEFSLVIIVRIVSERIPSSIGSVPLRLFSCKSIMI